MSALPESSAVPVPPLARERLVPLLRGALALALGVVITFSPDHSARFGAVAFGVFALATAAVLAVGAVADRRASRPLGQGLLLLALALAAGVMVLLLPAELFVGVVSAWALLSGAVELVGGLIARRAGRTARDGIVTGALLLLLAVVLLVVPPDYSQPWQVIGDEGVEASGAVTADIMTVGIIGAWAVIHGLLLVIQALTPRRPEPAP